MLIGIIRVRQFGQAMPLIPSADKEDTDVTLFCLAGSITSGQYCSLPKI
jgi:hypothetical protein